MLTVRASFWLIVTPLKLAFRRRFPRRQDVTCSSCGAELRERRRRPCLMCGNTTRTLVRGAEFGSIRAHDLMG